MSHVTHATAARLKAAGFPQPAFATGQMWFNKHGEASFVGRRDLLEKTGDETFFCTSVRSGRTEEFTPIHDGSFFAPTAEDILRELPGYSIHKFDNHFQYGSDFGCFRGVKLGLGEMCWHDKSLAEALAKAWLAIHEKKA